MLERWGWRWTPRPCYNSRFPFANNLSRRNMATGSHVVGWQPEPVVPPHPHCVTISRTPNYYGGPIENTLVLHKASRCDFESITDHIPGGQFHQQRSPYLEQILPHCRRPFGRSWPENPVGCSQSAYCHCVPFVLWSREPPSGKQHR